MLRHFKPSVNDKSPDLQQAASAFQAGDFATAERHVDRVLADAPNDAGALALKASIVLKRGNFQAAADMFGKVLELLPANKFATANRAMALVRLGRFADVRTLLGDVETWRDYVELQNVLMHAMIECGDLSEAESALAKILYANPNNPDLFKTLGLLRQRQRRQRESYDAYLRAADLSKNEVGSLTVLLNAALHLDGDAELTHASELARRELVRLPLCDGPAATLCRAQIRVLIKLRRIEEARDLLFEFATQLVGPKFADDIRSDRLIDQGRYAEAAEIIENAIPRCIAQEKGALNRINSSAPYQPIKRAVIHKDSWLMQSADALELSLACKLPVQLIDLYESPPESYVSPDTLVLFTSGIDGRQAYVINSIKRAVPSCPVIAWHRDNHHRYLWNALVAANTDLSFPAHLIPIDYMTRWTKRDLGPRLPLAVFQWSRTMLEKLYMAYGRGNRSNALSGNFMFYAVGHRRNEFLVQIKERWPEANITISTDGSYHFLSPEERFLTWSRYKTSLVLPVAGDLSMRFFDALASGQVPIVSRDIIGFDDVISKQAQAGLPIIRLEDYTLSALHEAHAAAIKAFDIGGEKEAENRHRFVLDHHMIANRIRILVGQTADILNLNLINSSN